jgi:hypothetical protein
MSIVIPPELHRVFKATCAAQGKQMTDVLLEAIRSYIAKNAPATSPKKGGR